MTVLVTGFDPFGANPINSSEWVVRSLQNQSDEIHTVVLPTSYQRAADEVIRLLETQPFRAVLMLGLAQDSHGLRFEQIALNLDDASAPDNDGVQRPRGVIVPGAPVAYRSTLPLEAMSELAIAQGEPVSWSRDAGGYVCNHTFFRVAHYLASVQKSRFVSATPSGEAAELHLPCGFVHLPPLHRDEIRAARLARVVRAWAQLYPARGHSG